jgi:cytidyltransferase-like protein
MKVTNLAGAERYARAVRQQGMVVGLVVGSFDVLHMGHANLLRLAKRRTGNVIVGLDNDETVRMVKGANRPINSALNRAKMLAELETVDRVFVIDKTYHHDSEEGEECYLQVVKTIKPTHIFTHPECDVHWAKKVKIAKSLGIKFQLDHSKKVTNSGVIIEKMNGV